MDSAHRRYRRRNSRDCEADVTFVVATYNVHHRRPDAAIRRDVDKLIATGADVICLQEMGGHDEVLVGLPKGWRFHTGQAGRGDGRADTPILFNGARSGQIRKGARHVSSPTKVEDGAGGTDVPEKTVTWTSLHVRDVGLDVAVLNTHAIPSIDAHGRPSPHHPKRVALFADLMRVLVNMAERRPDRLLLICGDLNVDYRADAYVQDHRFPFRTFGATGIHASYRALDVPEKQGRLIDYVCHRVDARLVPQSQEILDGYGSDHKPLVVTYRLAGYTPGF